MIYVGIVLCAGTPFLLLFGTRISARIRSCPGGPVTDSAAHLTAQALAEHGRLDPDAVTHADIDAAADYAGAARPATSNDRHAVRAALYAIGEDR